ncbi:hypothetical protein BGZ72_002015 [Mortierella alpina]|nr:hypothetical protein BGZ72_002015 [Mortierella alpina]
MSNIRRAMAKSVVNKLETRATISRYVVQLSIDPHELLQVCSSLGNQFLSGPMEDMELLFHIACCQILQEMLGEEHMLLSEQASREDVVQEQDAYSGFFTITGRVSRTYLAEHVIYSKTFICINPKCNNRNCLHFTPSATRNRVIKRTEDDGFMETGSSATLLPIDLVCSHCNMEMPESVIDRVYTVQQKIVVDCLNAAQGDGCFINQIRATLKDDLVNTAALGDSIQLLGRLSRSVVHKTEEAYLHGIEIEVNNILNVPNTSNACLPESIESILRSNMSPWNTSQAVVDLLDHITPRDTYRKLKLALLLRQVDFKAQELDFSGMHSNQIFAIVALSPSKIKNAHLARNQDTPGFDVQSMCL